MNPDLLTALMDRAQEEELGIWVSTNNPKLLATKLMNHRRVNNMSEHSNLIFAIPSVPDALFIVKETVDLGDGE